jgi:hypothetical protein
MNVIWSRILLVASFAVFLAMISSSNVSAQFRCISPPACPAFKHPQCYQYVTCMRRVPRPIVTNGCARWQCDINIQ